MKAAAAAINSEAKCVDLTGHSLQSSEQEYPPAGHFFCASVASTSSSRSSFRNCVTSRM